MDDKREEILSAGTKWLLEMEVINSPHLKNFLILNIYSLSKYIKNVEILSDSTTRVMLICLELSFFGRLFKKQKQIETLVQDNLSELLPSYVTRVIFDPILFSKALQKAKNLVESR